MGRTSEFNENRDGDDRTDYAIRNDDDGCRYRRRAPGQSPDTKATVAYLVASGATAITITEADGVCAFRIGSKMLARSVAIFWIMEVFGVVDVHVESERSRQPRFAFRLQTN